VTTRIMSANDESIADDMNGNTEELNTNLNNNNEDMTKDNDINNNTEDNIDDTTNINNNNIDESVVDDNNGTTDDTSKEEDNNDNKQEIVSTTNDDDFEDIHIMKIFKKFKCSRIILSFLRLSHIVSLSFLSKSLNRVVNKYYGDCSNLDLSEYYGVIGSTEFDHKSFMEQFLPKFKSVQSLSLRYCSHLKVVHLDNIIKALSTNSQNRDDDKDRDKESGNDDEQIKNEKLKELNLYFCSRLGSRALWKISSRLINLEYLNLARCYQITADKNINGLKLLGSLPLKELAISLDPSIQKTEAIDVYSLLIDEDSFRSLKKLDLSHGCEVLHEIEDLSDLTQIRKIEIIKPIKHSK